MTAQILPLRGRGAGSNLSGRFESRSLEPDPGEEPLPHPRTQFLADHSRTVISRTDSPDVGFRASVNPYRGCEHGCAYCYARPTHEYFGMSAGLDFETKVLVKHEAPVLLRSELLKPRYEPETLNFSGVTDCYQPAERRFRLTRSCLEVLAEFRHPFTIITKNALVTRDLDIIAPMASLQAAAVFVSVTSLDPKITEVMEPRTSRPAARLEAIRALSEAGVPVGVMVAPVIPGITDHELPLILEAAANAGATHAGFTPVRLPLSVAPLFEEWLGNHFPDRKERVLNRIRSMRGGKLNDPNFRSRMRGEGEFASLLSQMFHTHVRKLGLNRERLELSHAHFQRPGEQLGLF
ncbi:MAG: PA0069 family radical SAM protein [Bdellovibrionota bacterium]